MYEVCTQTKWDNVSCLNEFKMVSTYYFTIYSQPKNSSFLHVHVQMHTPGCADLISINSSHKYFSI